MRPFPLFLPATILLAGICAAQQLSFYPFSIDQDRLSGAPDFSFLNQPLDDSSRLFVKNGQFFRVGADLQPNTGDDVRVRLFGVNLAFGANFPAGADAPRIAKRLRRLGVNVVRLHHMDSIPDGNPQNSGSLLTTGPYPTLNSVAVARLRAFLDALKAEGVYCNLNLHVGYQFRPGADGVPARTSGAGVPEQSKPLHMIHPRLIELQQQYAAAVLNTLKLRDDPVLGVVEINNETSLADAWQNGQIDRFVDGEYRTVFTARWNEWLGTKYPNSGALRAAWAAAVSDGPELLNASGWLAEIHSPAQASFQMTSPEGEPVLQMNVRQGGAPAIFKQVGFSVDTSRAYTASIELRANLADGQSRTVYWDVKQDVSPWRTVNGMTINVTNQWQRYTMSFTSSFPMDGIGRFAISVENVPGDVFARRWSLSQPAPKGLAAEESLEAANVSLVTLSATPTIARAEDFAAFLADRDAAYLSAILSTVRDQAGPLVPVAGTQMDFGGLLNLDSHAVVDYQDSHWYVDHYGFPGTAWDGRDWTFQDISAVANSTQWGAGLRMLSRSAASRQAGRPFTVSEFNQPWPNTYASQTDPVTSAFAAFQDWDGLMHFAYSHGRNWDDNVPNGFNINGDWSKFTSFGQSAFLFRTGAIQTGTQPLVIPVSRAQRIQATRQRVNASIPEFLATEMKFNADQVFRHPVALTTDESAAFPGEAAAPGAAQLISDTGELQFERQRGIFTIQSAQAAGVFGKFLGTVTAGAIDVNLDADARGFASVLLTTLDGQAIGDSSRLLLTTPGYTLRSQPGESPARPQQIAGYRGSRTNLTIEPEPRFSFKPSGDLNGGVGPTWMSRVRTDLTLRTTAASITVYPLDGTGQRLDALPASDVQPASGAFLIRLQNDGQKFAPWYEIVALR